jgi:hypothetical protein
MDGIVLGSFLIATFLGGVTTGLAGFAMGLVVSGIWLHILTPLVTATLISGFGFVSQGYAIWKFRAALNWRKAVPLIIGSALGVPIGVWLLAQVNANYVRAGVGLLLVLYSTYGLVRPALKPLRVGATADIGAGIVNGVLGGMTGLGGVVAAIWCQVHDWPKDVQRAVFQPVIFVVQGMTTIWLITAAGAATAETIKLFVMGVPVLFGGMWIGLKLYGRLDEARFRKLVLMLLLLSGISLIVKH